jgi:GT2 family glycosyltransferase/SAM-dependent methyltransferase
MAELSIVIPTLDRAGVLRQALDRLGRQEGADGRFEVVVVADAAERDLPAVDAAVGEWPFPVRLLQARVKGASAARNVGWRAAESPLVLFIGDDILAEPRLVAEHLDWHERNPDPEVAVLGDVRWADSLERTRFMRWLDQGWQYDYPAIQGDDAGWGRFYTSNVSVKRELLDRSGGFDEQFPYLSEDIELGRRLRDLGLRLLYNRAARAEHLHAPTLDDWRARMATAARAEHRLHQKHPDIAPYFLTRFRTMLERPPRGRGARLAGVVPRGTPWLGPKVWASVDAQYTLALAPSFIEAWEAAERELPDHARWEHSRERWRRAQPDARLTWGTELEGDAFIERASTHGAFGPGRTVVEVGPGYGRLLRAALEAGVEFGRWTGVDLSADIVRYLREEFADPRVAFVNADAEKVTLDEPADALISSLTFKHLYPSFEAALANLAGGLRAGGVVVIDLIEGERAFFEPDGVTYIRWYTRDQVTEIFHRAGLDVTAFDEVRHHPDVSRLLAVGSKR